MSRSNRTRLAHRKRYRLKEVTPPSGQVVSTADMKNYLRVDSDAEDATIDAMILAATEKVEEYTNLKMLTQVWKVIYDEFGQTFDAFDRDGTFERRLADTRTDPEFLFLPLGPVQSVTSLTTFDDDDTGTVFASGNYFVDDSDGHGRLVLRNGSTWPTTVLRPANGIEIEFTAGYGLAADVPNALVQAIKIITAHLYERRGDTEDNSKQKMPATAFMLCERYRVLTL